MPSLVLGTTLIGPNNETFKVTDFLGQGAFGEVYRAVGQLSGSVVAVKIIPIGTLDSDESKRALLNEVKAAEQIKHPNVVEVLFVNDGIESAIGPYVVMEYVSGGTLAKLLRVQGQSGDQISLKRALEIMMNIAQGAKAINEKIIHRDIKPDNILIEGNTFKIGDFGISKFVDENTRLHTFKGSQHIHYMAPEGWQQLPNTFKLDVYSVGLVFYQILTLQHPLRAKVNDPSSFQDWETAHLFEQCPDVRTIRPDAPTSLAQLLSRMVSKRPADRPSWDDVLEVLSRPEAAGPSQNASIAAAVEAAVVRKQRIDEGQTKSEAEARERQKQLAFYRYSCDTLLKKFDPLIDQFNQTFQHGKITIESHAGTTIYSLPLGRNVQLSFFEPKKSGIRLRNGEVIGGGWLGIARGRSSNLVLIKQGAEDLYGNWMLCEVRLMALVDANKIIGKFGITRDTVVPFGFKDAYFYDQIQYASGAMHAFTYTFFSDLEDYFAGLVHEACG